MSRAALSHPEALPAGTRLAEFEIEDVLGMGGFGIVYRALDKALERVVAIKEYIPSSLATRREDGVITLRQPEHAATFELGRRSFLNEARLLAKFDHPALVKVYRFWEANQTAYMVMPYYQGITLHTARRQMSAPPSQAWLDSLLDRLLGALEILHQAQVYHRDIAPDNILLTGDLTGETQCYPVLLDFGAARHVIGDHAQSLTTIVKPSFAPIEQYAELTKLRQGPWTDLYALGAVLYYCLTGRPPLPATVRAVQDDLTPLSTLSQHFAQEFNRPYSAQFLNTIDQALALNPTDRIPNTAAWRAACPALGPTASVPTAAPTITGQQATVLTPPNESLQAAQHQAYMTTIPAAKIPFLAGATAEKNLSSSTAPTSATAHDLQTTLPYAASARERQMTEPLDPPTAKTDSPPHQTPRDQSKNTALPPTSTPAKTAWFAHPTSELAILAIGLLGLGLIWRTLVLPPRSSASTPAPQAAIAASQISASNPARPAAVITAAQPVSAPASKKRLPASTAGQNDDRSSADKNPPVTYNRRPSDHCKDRIFPLNLICLKRLCSKAEFYHHAECIQMRKQEEANRPPGP